MPIGKNAIKRVINNGYSGVKTGAPDMENSTIEEPKKSESKKTVAKNPLPKAVTSKNGSGSSRQNPAPKAAILEGMQRIPAVKKSTPKAEPKIIELKKEETANELGLEISEEVKGTASAAVSEAIEEVKETVSTAVSESAEEVKEIVATQETEIAGEAEVKAEEINEITKEEVKEEENAPSEPMKSMESEPELAPVRTLEKVTEKSERCGEGYTNLGGNLPYYLL